MKVTVVLEGQEILQFDSAAMSADVFAEALKQSAIQLYSKWLAQTPPQDHKLKIKED